MRAGHRGRGGRSVGDRRPGRRSSDRGRARRARPRRAGWPGRRRRGAAPPIIIRWVGPQSVTSWPKIRCQKSSSGKPSRAKVLAASSPIPPSGAYQSSPSPDGGAGSAVPSRQHDRAEAGDEDAEQAEEDQEVRGVGERARRRGRRRCAARCPSTCRSQRDDQRDGGDQRRAAPPRRAGPGGAEARSAAAPRKPDPAGAVRPAERAEAERHQDGDAAGEERLPDGGAAGRGWRRLRGRGSLHLVHRSGSLPGSIELTLTATHVTSDDGGYAGSAPCGTSCDGTSRAGGTADRRSYRFRSRVQGDHGVIRRPRTHEEGLTWPATSHR